jgi:hypothetical protein
MANVEEHPLMTSLQYYYDQTKCEFNQIVVKVLKEVYLDFYNDEVKQFVYRDVIDPHTNTVIDDEFRTEVHDFAFEILTRIGHMERLYFISLDEK